MAEKENNLPVVHEEGIQSDDDIDVTDGFSLPSSTQPPTTAPRRTKGELFNNLRRVIPFLEYNPRAAKAVILKEAESHIVFLRRLEIRQQQQNRECSLSEDDIDVTGDFRHGLSTDEIDQQVLPPTRRQVQGNICHDHYSYTVSTDAPTNAAREQSELFTKLRRAIPVLENDDRATQKAILQKAESYILSLAEHQQQDS